MERSESRRVIWYLLWLSGFSIVLLLLPSYLGLLIARNQWPLLWLLALGFMVITLYFSEFRYLIFVTSLVLILANSRFEERNIIKMGS